MRLKLTDKPEAAICAALLFAAIWGHTYILYAPKLALSTILLQAIIRFGVALAPFLFTRTLQLTKTRFGNVLGVVLWLFFIPYPFYNFFQLRHIAEIFTLSADTYFTQSASLHELWKIIPVAIYACSQLLLFFYCSYQIIYRNRNFITQFILNAFLVFYAACATTFGIASRLDTFHILTKPQEVITAAATLSQNNSYLLNTTIIFITAFTLQQVFFRLSRPQPRAFWVTN